MSKLVIKSYGTDPELLLKNNETGKFISSFGLIPGDKNEPVKLEDLGKGYSIQKDNVLVEFCVPPSKDFLDLYSYIKKAINYTQEHILPKSIEIVSQTTGEYDESELDNPFARTFGCSPSYNGWTKLINHSAPNNSNYRSSGFHIHFGLSDDSPNTVFRFIQLLDLTVGIPSVIIDGDRIRKKQYGQAGEFRPTNYGCEYRVLGGYVMQSRDNFVAIKEGIDLALDMFNSSFKFKDTTELNIQTAINTGNSKIAGDLIAEFKLESILDKVLIIE